MRILALFALCTVSALTQGVPVEPLSRDTVNNKDYQVVVTNLFFKESTITIPPSEFGVGPETEYIVLETSLRFTSTNAHHIERAEDFNYIYYFDPSNEIVLFIRQANTPIWYGIAVAATAVAMAGFYLAVRKRKAANTTTT